MNNAQLIPILHGCQRVQLFLTKLTNTMLILENNAVNTFFLDDNAPSSIKPPDYLTPILHKLQMLNDCTDSLNQALRLNTPITPQQAQTLLSILEDLTKTMKSAWLGEETYLVADHINTFAAELRQLISVSS